MRKRILVFAVIVCLIVCAIPARAVEPRWTNTMKIVLAQDYYYTEGVYCYVEIVGHDFTTSIQNIDIVLSKQVGDDWVEVESWLDASVDGNEFLSETVSSIASVGYTYRLSVTADVYAGNVVEHVESYYDKEY